MSIVLCGMHHAVHAQQPESARAGLEEVLVTAQKRVEKLEETPVSVSVINAQTLADDNQVLLQEYYSSVPGLSLSPGSQSVQTLSIRGITTGFGNPTVGIVIDDVPFGASSGFGGLVVPEIDPGDLARVEVLRGPQGTLYGANSMGGLLKFVTLDPSTEGYSGRIQAGVSGVHNGAGAGYNFRASMNVPLGDAFAVRASGFTRQDPGYIDNPVLNINGINKDRISGGRLAALWRPSDSLSLKISALYQYERADGLSEANQAVNGYGGPPLGDLQQNYIRGVGAHDRRIQAYSAALTARFGTMDLVAVSGYNVNRSYGSQDFTFALGPYTQDGVPGTGFNGFGVTGTPLYTAQTAKKFTQEVRLSGSIGPSIEWLFGGFYTHENSPAYQRITAENTATGQTVGEWVYINFPTTLQEYAAFTDLTYHFSDRLDVQIGGRESQNRQTIIETIAGPYDPAFFGVPSPITYPELSIKHNAFTYLVTPRFKISPELMLYARMASGYRVGSPNATPGEPPQSNPDKTQSYELGVKGDFINHALSLEASVYYIRWKDIQLNLLDAKTQFNYTGNASEAKSKGLELSVESRPLNGLKIGAWIALNDATLTRGFPPGPSYGVSGDRLPNATRFSGNVSVQQDFPFSSSVTGFVAGEVSYIGNRLGAFQGFDSAGVPVVRQNLPAYARTDLRAGVNYDSWTATFFVNNVADKRGLLEGGLDYGPPSAFVYIQPRTVGLNIVKKF